MESDTFDTYDAPKYFDFSANQNVEHEDKEVEEYFNYDHESIPQYETISSDEEDIPQDFYTPYKSDSYSTNPLRKSMSMGNIAPTNNLLNTLIPTDEKEEEVVKLSQKVGNISINGEKNTNVTKKQWIKGRSNSITRLHMYGSQKRLNELAQPKSRLTTNSYMSSAEFINKFQQNTPKRFHSKSKSQDKPDCAKSKSSIMLTMPQSPALATKQRHRPTTYLPQNEREELELEKMKKWQIKANPVPKVVLGPMKATVHFDKKPTTVVHPFHITQIVPKKVPEVKTTVEPFHARAVPKSLYMPEILPVKPKLMTVPVTPKVYKKVMAEREKQKQQQPEKVETAKNSRLSRLTRTNPEPFSFQNRDQEFLKKRDKLITKVMEEEKKNRVFHARPIPKYLNKSPQVKLRGANSRENIPPAHTKSDENIANKTIFKARPASVLLKQPFIPKPNKSRPLTEISAFNLNTEVRAAEREQFDKKVREMDEITAENKRQLDLQREQAEKEEAILLRKMTERKANPIRHFKQTVPVTPKSITVPVSPKFLKKE